MFFMVKIGFTKHAKANKVRLYGHVLRREDAVIYVLWKAVGFKMDRQKKKGRPKITWLTQVEKEIKKVCLKQKDASNRMKWWERVNKMAMRCAPPLSTSKHHIKKLDDDDMINKKNIMLPVGLVNLWLTSLEKILNKFIILMVLTSSSKQHSKKNFFVNSSIPPLRFVFFICHVV